MTVSSAAPVVSQPYFLVGVGSQYRPMRLYWSLLREMPCGKKSPVLATGGRPGHCITLSKRPPVGPRRCCGALTVRLGDHSPVVLFVRLLRTRFAPGGMLRPFQYQLNPKKSGSFTTRLSCHSPDLSSVPSKLALFLITYDLLILRGVRESKRAQNPGPTSKVRDRRRPFQKYSWECGDVLQQCAPNAIRTEVRPPD
jgi:hypothetical protein